MIDFPLDVAVRLVAVAVSASFDEPPPSEALHSPTDIGDVVRAAEATIAARPDDPEAYVVAAMAKRGWGRRREVLDDLATAIRFAPGHARVWLLLSEVLASEGATAGARAARARAVALDSEVAAA